MPKYMTVTQYLRHRAINRNTTPSLEELQKSEWCKVFAKKMLNRLVIGAFRYGLIKDGCKDKGTRRTDYMLTKLKLYCEDGNAEHLVDIANFCMVEYREQNHPKFHFAAQDDKNHMR